MTVHSTADVVVIGAGPAGSTAAIVLARAGRSVIVVDKATFPRDKCCGDGLTTLALRELEPLGLRPSMVPSWKSVDAAWLRSPSGREVCVPLPPDGIFAATTPRRELDAALVDLAIDAGATVHQGHAFEAIRQSPSSVEVDVAGVGTVTASFVVAADGMWSATRKALGVGQAGYLGEWHAFRQYVSSVTGPAAERLIVWFEPELLPGYMWSFPLPNGRANIGFGVQRDGNRRVRDMKQLWNDLLQRRHVVEALGSGFELEDRHTAWPIPAGIDRATLTSGRVCFVGDAAMAADTMTGEGIGQALLTGRLAAEAILGHEVPDVVARRYRSTVRGHLVADHRMSVLLSKMLSHQLGTRGAIRLLATSEWSRRNFARWMFEDEPRAIAFTPSRWHRRFLHQPGPFQHDHE
jgi:geranylgeranyl reductase family protein